MNGKYYWLKLKKDFFKRHDIRIIEGMPDGKEIVLFYIKLMLESVDHDGELRFSDEIPYSPEMLASVTDTDIEIVNKAMIILTSLKLLTVDENKTIVLPKVSSMVGYETEWAKKKREYRESQGQNEDKEKTMSGQCQDNVLPLSDKSKSKSKSIELDIKEKSIKEKSNSRFVPPTLDEVKAYCQERNSCVDPNTFFTYFTEGGWKDSKGNPVKNWKQKLITWENHNSNGTSKSTPMATAQPSGSIFDLYIGNGGVPL